MNAKIARLANHFLRYPHLNLVKSRHFLYEFTPKTAVDEHPLDPPEQRVVRQLRPPSQRTLAVVGVGRQHPRSHRGPGRIAEHEPLAPVD